MEFDLKSGVLSGKIDFELRLSSVHTRKGIDHPKITRIGKIVTPAYTCARSNFDWRCVPYTKTKAATTRKGGKHLNNFEFNRRTLMSRNLCGYQMSLYYREGYANRLLPVNKLQTKTRKIPFIPESSAKKFS